MALSRSHLFLSSRSKLIKNNSWKEKIGHAFNDLIKVYLDYIKLTYICNADKHKRYLPLDEWQSRFNRILEKIHKQSVLYTSEEIEADISDAIRETRKEKRGC